MLQDKNLTSGEREIACGIDLACPVCREVLAVVGALDYVHDPADDVVRALLTRGRHLHGTIRIDSLGLANGKRLFIRVSEGGTTAKRTAYRPV